MRYSFRNTLCGLAVLAAAGLLADHAVAQGNITLLADEDEINLTPDADTGDISLDISLPGGGGLISPASATHGDESQSDVIPMEVNTDLPGQVSLNFDDQDADIDMQIDAEPRDIMPVAAPAMAPQPSAPLAVIPSNTNSGALLGTPQVAPSDVPVLSDNINNELFNRMSDLEKQTTLLNLELKKERVANEIAAVKAQREKALQEEEARRKEEARNQQEWENEQARLMVEEQRKLKEVEMALEKLRQEKIVKAYKESMLASTQKWIKKNAEIYAEIAKKDEQIKNLIADQKAKLGVLKQKAEDTRNKAEVARVNHDKKIANLESQISILKTRLEAEIEKAKQAASRASRKNPFAEGGTEAVAPEKVKLSKEYAIMEITGSGDELAARLINEDGDVFMVKVGTTLRNGYTVDEISQTYLSAVRDNEKDYLYFSAGGILDREPVKPAVNIKEPTKDNGSSSSKSSRGGRISDAPVTKGIPSLGRGMIVK